MEHFPLGASLPVLRHGSVSVLLEGQRANEPRLVVVPARACCSRADDIMGQTALRDNLGVDFAAKERLSTGDYRITSPCTQRRPGRAMPRPCVAKAHRPADPGDA